MHMSKEKSCPHDMSQACLDDEAQTLWITYFGQYEIAVNTLLHSGYVFDCFLPLLNIVSTYMELWAKAIGMNFGLGSDKSIIAELFKGHDFTTLMEKLRDSISWDEYDQIKDDFFQVWEIVDYLVGLKSDAAHSLSEATRYPETLKGKNSLNPCAISFLEDMCNQFPIEEIVDKIEELTSLTYKIYDQIYEMRVI